MTKFHKPDVAFRLMRESDKNFIINSWLQSYRNSPTTVSVSNGVYYTFQSRIIETILDYSTPIMAVDTEDDNIILGYICAQICAMEKMIVDWVYVKHNFKNFGLASALIGEMQEAYPVKVIEYTHQPKVTSKHFLDKLSQNYTVFYNPFKATRHLGFYHYEDSEDSIVPSHPRQRREPCYLSRG